MDTCKTLKNLMPEECWKSPNSALFVLFLQMLLFPRSRGQDLHSESKSITQTYHELEQQHNKFDSRPVGLEGDG